MLNAGDMIDATFDHGEDESRHQTQVDFKGKASALESSNFAADP